MAVVGDSYIEGDIFTQDPRELFQDAYGGEGVGCVNMHSDFLRLPPFGKTGRFRLAVILGQQEVRQEISRPY